MPRKSAAALSTISAPSRSLRLQPPPSLGKDERAVFLEIVGSNEPGHFRPSDAPLLASYAEVIVTLRLAARELKRGMISEDWKISPWFAIQERAIKSQVALSMRLRLSPQARQPNNPSRPVSPMTAYEEIRANGHADD